jgi:hypothetical protein
MAVLTLNPLTWKIWWAPNNASKWQMGFNSGFKGLMTLSETQTTQCQVHTAKVSRFSQWCDWRLHSSKMWCCITNYPVTQHHRPEEQVLSSDHYDCILHALRHSYSRFTEAHLALCYAQQICLSCRERHSKAQSCQGLEWPIQTFRVLSLGMQVCKYIYNLFNDIQ